MSVHLSVRDMYCDEMVLDIGDDVYRSLIRMWGQHFDSYHFFCIPFPQTARDHITLRAITGNYGILVAGRANRRVARCIEKEVDGELSIFHRQH